MKGFGKFRGRWAAEKGGAIAALFLIAGCHPSQPDRLQGYVDGQFVYVASPLPGMLESLHVQRGAQVKAGEELFALESGSEKAARDEAQRRLAQARANLEDAKKGRRPSEIESLDAQVQQAKSAAMLSEMELYRQEKLIRTGATSASDVDRAKSTHEQNKQHMAQLEADLRTAKMGSRSDLIAAAEAEVQARGAAYAKAEWDLAQKHQSATHAGVVFDTLYREGEWIAAGRPVAVLLSPGNVKVRAFVPEPRLGNIHQGDSLRVHVDGVAEPITGKVSFVSPQAEYTPPVIYSNENRAKLVFLIELVFDPATAIKLHPGQPVDVLLSP